MWGTCLFSVGFEGKPKGQQPLWGAPPKKERHIHVLRPYKLLAFNYVEAARVETWPGILWFPLPGGKFLVKVPWQSPEPASRLLDRRNGCLHFPHREGWPRRGHSARAILGRKSQGSPQAQWIRACLRAFGSCFRAFSEWLARFCSFSGASSR